MRKQSAKPKIKTILNEYNRDIKRHMSVLSEDFQNKVQTIAEQYGNIKKTLDSHTEMIVSMKEDIEIMKLDIEFIKGSFKKKVDYEEFAALERRMSVVESKIRR